MKFMTAASLRNPNRLSGVLSKMSEEKLLNKKKERISQVAQNIMDGISSLSPEQRTDMDSIMQVTQSAKVPGMTGQELNLAANMAFQYQQQAQKQQSYNRKNDIFKRKEKDTQLLDQMNYPQQYGTDVYEAPAGDLLGEMSPEGRSQYMGARSQSLIDSKKRDLENAKLQAEINYKNAQAGNVGKTALSQGALDKTIKRNESNAISDLQMHFGERFDPETNTIVIPTDKDGNPSNPQDLQFIDQSGFNFDSPDKVMQTDSSHFFGAIGDDKYARVIRLGGYDPNKKVNYNEILPPQNMQNQGSKPTKRAPLDSFKSDKKVNKKKQFLDKIKSKKQGKPTISQIWKNGKKINIMVLPDGNIKEITKDEAKSISNGGSLFGQWLAKQDFKTPKRKRPKTSFSSVRR